MTLGILSRIQRDIIVHIANDESMWAPHNIKVIKMVLTDIAYRCTDIQGDIWLFTQATWLLCQLKREGK